MPKLMGHRQGGGEWQLELGSSRESCRQASEASAVTKGKRVSAKLSERREQSKLQ